MGKLLIAIIAVSAVAILLIIILPATLVPRPVDCGNIVYEVGSFSPPVACFNGAGSNTTLQHFASGQLQISAYGSSALVQFGMKYFEL